MTRRGFFIPSESIIDVNNNLLSFLSVLFMYLHKKLEISNHLTGVIVVLVQDLNNSAFEIFLFYRIF